MFRNFIELLFIIWLGLTFIEFYEQDSEWVCRVIVAAFIGWILFRILSRRR
jgi:hypothetical protein